MDENKTMEIELSLRSGKLKRLWAHDATTGRIIDREGFERYMRENNPEWHGYTGKANN
jgi:hypothetical protein